MIKIASVYFPKDLYNSFKKNNVVVFAGAGVSMGEPSGLPSFSKLADDIAEVLGTINYEIVCMVSNRVPRIYLRR